MKPLYIFLLVSLLLVTSITGYFLFLGSETTLFSSSSSSKLSAVSASAQGTLKPTKGNSIPTTYQPTYEKTCTQIDATTYRCTQVQYSGVRFADAQGTKIEDAVSLKGSAIVPIITKSSLSDANVTIKDYNLTSITIYNISASGISLPIKYFERNETDGTLKEDTKQKQTINPQLTPKSTEFQIKYTLGDEIHLGTSSTVITLSKTDVLKDTYVNSAAANTNFGTAVRLNVLNRTDTPANQYTFINFDLTTLPSSDITVLTADLILTMAVNEIEWANFSNISAHHLYSNYSWNETVLTWNDDADQTIGNASRMDLTIENNINFLNGTDGDFLTGTNHSFNVTNSLQNEYDFPGTVTNFSLALWAHQSTDTAVDRIRFHSSDGLTVDTPILNVTYVEGTAVSACGTLDITGANYTLINDVSSSGNCFSIAADNITFDGGGFSMTGDGGSGDEGFGDSSSVQSFALKNVDIHEFGRAVYFSSAGNNSLIENITVNGTGTLAVWFGANNHFNTVRNIETVGVSRGVRITGGTNNLIDGNRFINGTYGIFESGVSFDNTFLNNNFTGNTFAIDDLAPASGELDKLVYNNSHGEIFWTNTSFREDVVFTSNLGLGINLSINNNSVAFNPTGFTGRINSSGNITLYGIGDRGFSSPVILIDDLTTCDSTTTPACSNFTALTADTVEFNVSSWSQNFSIGDAADGPTEVTACQTLDVEGATYELQNDIDDIVSGCLRIKASGITLDGKGFNVTTKSNIITVDDLENITIKNIGLLLSETLSRDRTNILVSGGINNITFNNITFFQRTLGGRDDIKIDFTGANTNVTIINNLFNSSGARGPQVRGVQGDPGLIDSNVFEYRNAGHDGVNILMSGSSNTANMRVTNNNFTMIGTIGAIGINFQIFYTNLTIANNRFEVTRTAIKQSGSSSSSVQRGLIYNNLINTSSDFRSIDLDSANGDTNYPLNTTKTLQTSIVGGLNIGGNYYAEFTGGGYSETCVDSDLDDICDVPLQSFVDDGIDYLPLTLTSGDAQDPFIRIDRPRNLTFVNGNVNIRATATDNIAVTNVSMWYTNSSVGITEICHDTSAPYACNWNTKDFSADSEGYTIVVNATDAAGNTNTTGILLRIDRFIPETDNLTVYYPLDQTSVRDGQTLWLDLMVKDTSGAGMNTTEDDLTNLNQTLNTTLRHVSGSLEAELWSLWNQSIVIDSFLNDSFAQVLMYAYDNATPDNNLREDNWNVQIDNEVPTFNVPTVAPSSPGNNSLATFSTIAFENFDLRNYTLETNGTGVWTNTSGIIDGTSDSILEDLTVVYGNWSFRFHITDDAGNINTSVFQTFEVQADPDEFIVNLLHPPDNFGNTTTNNSFYFEYRNGLANNCTLIMDSVLNGTLTNPTENATLQINTVIDDGVHLWTAECYNANENQTETTGTRTINIDSTPPRIENLTENPSDPATWQPTKDYIFNASIFDNIALESFGIEFNGVNNTPITADGLIYSRTESNLPAGVYNYYWWANDTSGLRNVTAVQTYTINNATGQVQLALNDTEEDLNGTTVTNVKVTGSTLYGTLNITRDGIDVANETGIYVTMSVGYYNYTATSSGDANHDTAVVTRFANITTPIDNAPPYFTNIPDDKAIDYGVEFIDDFNATDDVSFDAFVVNDTGLFNIGATTGIIGNSTSLGGGVYVIQVTINDSSNNLNSTNYTLTVNAISSTIFTYVNHSRANLTIENGTTIALNSTLSVGVGDISLYNNETLINNGSSPLFNNTLFGIPGLYNITTIFEGNENWSRSIEEWNVSVNAPAPVDITPPYFTNIPDDKNISFGAIFIDDFNATDAVGFDAFVVNNTNLFSIGSTSGEINNISSLQAGNYTIQVTINDTSNNLNSTNYTLTVLQGIPGIALAITPSNSETYPTETTATGSGCPTELTCNLFLNNQSVSNGHQEFFGADAPSPYYEYNTTGNINWTTASATDTITISQGAGVVITHIDGVAASKSINNGTLNTNASGILSVGNGTISLYVNDTLWNQGNSVLTNISNFTVGTYNINATYLGNANWTGDSEVWTLTVALLGIPSNNTRIFPSTPGLVPYIRLGQRLVFP